MDHTINSPLNNVKSKVNNGSITKSDTIIKQTDNKIDHTQNQDLSQNKSEIGHQNIKKPFRSDLWSIFDAIYCINLDTRVDRRQSAQKIFDQYQIPAKMFVVKKHPNGGIEGCFDSHLRIIREAYHNGYSKICIFEDDIAATSHLSVKQLRKATKFMETNADWDLFYLGTCPDVRKYTCRWLTNSIYQLRSVCTHAYCVSRKMMEKMISKHIKYQGVPIDYLYKETDQFKSYGIYPSMFNQGAHTSDISSTDFYNGGIISNLKSPFIRGLEIYAKYINIPLNQLRLILFSLLVILLIWLLVKNCSNFRTIKILLIIFLPILLLLLIIRF